MIPFTYDLTTLVGQTRLLLNDVDQASAVFSDAEIQAFLDLELGSVKRAAAQAIDTNADNEALASKVLTDHQLTTNGAAVANALRARATVLRAQADVDDSKNEDLAVFEFVPYQLPWCP